jgi:uncharacterized membrane protein YbhN (UPF0104 family)
VSWCDRISIISAIIAAILGAIPSFWPGKVEDDLTRNLIGLFFIVAILISLAISIYSWSSKKTGSSISPI